MKVVRLLCVLGLLFVASGVLAQSGKIAGRVTDAANGEPLPGVNVVIEGTTQGATSDVDGYYNILNVRPGTYSVRATYIGYVAQQVLEVRVNIDLTTPLDISLREETVGLEEVVVNAERPIVQRDVSASVANIDQQAMENLPVTSVAEVIGLQAGFEPGLQVRGSGGNQVGFAVDGISFTDPRSNNPMTEISYTAIDEVQVQTGGFNAEYGNVRSGLINVVTKDPSRTRYSVDVIGRYSAPGKKYFTDFGSSPGDDHSFYKYPRLSMDLYPGDGNGDGTVAEGETCPVSICGTEILPDYLETQYNPFPGGWRSQAAQSEGGYTPEQMRAAQGWYYRKDFKVTEPDFEVDGTITGPVPGISKYLGDLRFSASFRQAQDAYLVPQQRAAEMRRTFQGKLVSDVGKGMRLVLSGLRGLEEGLSMADDGYNPNPYRDMSAEMPGYPWDGRDYLVSNHANEQIALFGDWMYSPRNVNRSVYGLEFTHTLNANTFYEVQLQRNGTDFLTGAPLPRGENPDGSPLVIACVTPNADIRMSGSCEANEIELNESPLGYRWRYDNTVFGSFGAFEGDARDSSKVVRWTGRWDLTSQMNRFLQFKTGLEYNYNDYNIKYGSWEPSNPQQENQRFIWHRNPLQGAAYAQAKLEFKGMVANLGLRMDYFHAGGEWYDYDAFTRIFSAVYGFDQLEEQLDKKPTDHQFSLSPRLGVSFPVTENSKFYFNYGHFRQMLDPYRLFEIQYRAVDQAVLRVGNPDHPMPKTVAYELGFEQNLADQFLLRLAGFYRDLSSQGRDVTYVSIDDVISYVRQEPLNYGDFRGFEVTLEKNRGNWLRGFVNYTYLSRKTGNFGYGTIDENRRAMREYMNSVNALSFNKPVPEPYANMFLELRVPQNVGLTPAVNSVLGDWRVALLGEWRNGAPSTWDGNNFSLNGTGQDRRIAYNVNWKDYWMFDLRLSKNFGTIAGDAQFFVDVTNVFNIKQMYWRNSNITEGANDSRDYFRSLHLSKEEDLFVEGYNPGYNWVPGDDEPGDYRKPGVAFDPIFSEADLGTVNTPIKNALYYDAATRAEREAGTQTEGVFKTHNGSAWVEADPARVKQVLDDKAYIDMPNESYLAFMNPRNVIFGVRLRF